MAGVWRKTLIYLGLVEDDELDAYSWPGNVRELENILRRAVLVAAGDTIGTADLGIGSAEAAVPQPEDMPERMAEPVRAWRETPGGRFALRMFTEHREQTVSP